MTEYRTLHEPEINRTLFQDFIRRQVVTKCWRREHGQWIIKDAPFIDDWTEEDYLVLILSILVDTFLSRISLTMLPAPNLHNTSCVLS